MVTCQLYGLLQSFSKSCYVDKMGELFSIKWSLMKARTQGVDPIILIEKDPCGGI